MASPTFITRDDTLRFRRITWLLSLLESKAEKHTASGNRAEEVGPLLGELTWLTNLLVRNHEVVAVMPHRSGQELYVVEPGCSGGIEGTCFIARNPRRDMDTVTAQGKNKAGGTDESNKSDSDKKNLPGCPRMQTRPQITICDVEKTRFDPFCAVPKESGFKEHVETIISCLKEIEQKAHPPTGGRGETPEDMQARQEEESDLIMDFHVYVLRSCFRKILVRTGYHCQSFREKRGSGSKVDYSNLFCPMPGWKQAHLRASGKHSVRIRGIYRYSLELLLESSGKGPQPNFALWEENDRGNSQNIFSEFTDLLATYQPNEYEQSISQYCSEEWSMPTLPLEKGFYLTAMGKEAYHGILMTALGNTLLGLKLISRMQDDVSNSLEDGSEVYDVLLFVARSFRILFYLAYYSPLLAIHLKWLLVMSSPEASQQQTPDPDQWPTHDSYLGSEGQMSEGLFLSDSESSEIQRGEKGDANQTDELQEYSPQTERGKQGEALDDSEISDIVPNFRFLRLGTDRIFPIHDNPVTSILRWLRLITLHTCSIESLVLTKTCDKLGEPDVKILQTPLPQVDNDMEPLDAYLKRLIPASEDQTLFADEIGRLSKNRVAEFNGTWHCEAILLSLYLSSREGPDNDGVPHTLRMAASNLFPHIVAVSKQCCPVCTTLFWVVSKELKWQPIAVIGSHDTYTACSLPPWLPKRFGDKVMEILERRLQLAVDERLEVLREHRQFSRGSVSPIYHGELTHSKAIRCLSGGLKTTGQRRSRKRKHH